MFIATANVLHPIPAPLLPIGKRPCLRA
jgi:ATP-dependent Lon protease